MKKRNVLKQPRIYEANARMWRGHSFPKSGKGKGGGGGS